MLFNAHTLALAALFSTLVTGRPFDSPKPRDVGRRDKSYSVVNVGGDASTPAPATATSVIETTKTVEVVGPEKTVTQQVTATVIKPQPAPAPTTSCKSSSASRSSSSSTPRPSSSTPAPTTTLTSSAGGSSSTPSPSVPSSTSTPTPTPTISSVFSSSISTPISTPKPIIVTVTISENEGPTEYYDDGMWHTYYRIKTFEAAAVVTAAPQPAA